MREVLSKDLARALTEVFDYLWHDEFKDFDDREHPLENHIACALQVVGRAIGRIR